MKKLVLTFFALLSGAILAAGAVRWEAGVGAGVRTIKDEILREAYGSGFVYTPYLSYRFSRSLWAGLEYEGGLTDKSKIGIFQEDSRLSISGVQAYLLYIREKGAVRPFAKIGIGGFRFKMDIASEFVQAYNFASSDVSILFAGGVKVRLSKKIFLNGEMKYTALWVDPFDDLVDLGGLRFLLGAGFQF